MMQLDIIHMGIKNYRFSHYGQTLTDCTNVSFSYAKYQIYLHRHQDSRFLGGDINVQSALEPVGSSSPFTFLISRCLYFFVAETPKRMRNVTMIPLILMRTSSKKSAVNKWCVLIALLKVFFIYGNIY